MQRLIAFLMLTAFAAPAGADEPVFTTGPVFADYGPVAVVDVTMPIPAGASLRHSFDAVAAAKDGRPVTTLVSAARFINMHARAGVPVDHIQVAVVVHGRATLAMTGEDSASADLVATLIEHGVRIIVCGQSAAHHGIGTDDLLPGVEMALSAMTAHALLQRQGYTLNPF